VVASAGPDAEETRELHSSNIELGAVAMTMLRAMVGFTFFQLAFWLRSQDQGTLWFGAVVGVSALATMVGNAVATAVRTRVREESMLVTSLAVCTVAGFAVALLGGPIGAVLLAGVLNLMAALGRLSFESIVQRDAPGANRGRAFAVFETRFQLAWALGAFIAVLVQAPGTVGFLAVAVAALVTTIWVIERRRNPGRSPVSRGRRGRARARAPRSRSGSASPRDR
jgi:MFS family permease